MVHGKEYSVDLAVTNSVDELILGIDWLTKNAAQWDFERGRIFLGGKWITLQQRITADRVSRVYAMDTIRIPPLSQADVSVNVTWPRLHPTQSNWLVEPKAVGGGLIVARMLVSGEVLNTAIRVINVTDQEYTIYCDDELGKACQATVTLETVDERPEQEAKTAASAGEAETFGLRCVYGARRLPVSLFPCGLRAEAGGRREILVRIHGHRSLYDFV